MKNSICKYSFLVLFVLCVVSNAWAQIPVSGCVQLSHTGNVEAVSIEFQSKNNSYTTTIHPKKDGTFNLDVPEDMYRIDLSFTGSTPYYYPILQDSVQIKKDFDMGIVQLDRIADPYNVFVKLPSNPSLPGYANIQTAIDALEAFGAATGSPTNATINLYAGAYSGNGNRDLRCWDPQDCHITLQGVSANSTIIHTTNCCKIFADFSVHFYFPDRYNDHDRIQNIHFHGGGPAIFVSDTAAPLFKNNIFSNAYPYYRLGSDGGASVFVENGHVCFENNQFIDNVTSESNTYGGAILIVDRSGGGYREVTLKNNEFIGNQAGSCGGAIHIDAIRTTVNIQNNTFKQNSVNYDLANNFGRAIACENCLHLKIHRNIFDDNGSTIPSTGYWDVICLDTRHEINGSDIFVSNNTFANNQDGIGIRFRDMGTTGNGSYSNLTIANNIFRDGKIGIYDGLNLNNHTVSVSNNCFFNQEYTPMYSNLESIAENTLLADPLLDSNYVPEWTTTHRSPVIDAGKFVMFLLELDATPMDIGARCAELHAYEKKSLPAGLTWCSFPVLDTRTNDNDVVVNVFPPILDNLFRVWTEDSMLPIIMENSNGWAGLDHVLDPTQGYKIEMNSADNLPITGFRCPSNTSIHINGGYQENWIGYFLEGSQTPQNAFPADVWSSLTMVKHQDWCLAKVNDQWTMQGTGFMLNDGDMVIVKSIYTKDFVWNTPGSKSESAPLENRRSKAEQFSYQEEADYVPVFMDFPNAEERPDEVGVFVNGICRGACNVLGEKAQVNAYIMDQQASGDELEFRFYYDSNGEFRKPSSYWVVNPEANLKELKPLCLNKREDYYFVQFGSKQGDAPAVQALVLALDQNYPNPFNPETQIAFALPQAADVQLTIYNIKGQHVKTLVNGALDAGHHSVLWNGVNESGEDVASGVYFYRLQAGPETLTKKMMLMK